MKTLTRRSILLAMVALLELSGAGFAAVPLDEAPTRPDEWGYRPEVGAVSEVTPPAFSWRPQRTVVSWELECGRGENLKDVMYEASDIRWNVHTPPETFPPGTYTWRYRGKTSSGDVTSWSKPRTFRVADGAVSMPLPRRGELLARIPTSHPRLFLRPEGVPRLRELARGSMRARFEKLVTECDRLLENPPPTEEPKKYPPDMKRGSEEWRALWWGNRTYTIRALNSAATLAFTRLLGGRDDYGALAKKLLLECARWDPVGATGYRYNDEAGMPYAYYFSRTYTFVHDLLTEAEREMCQRVMRVRGEEMYEHLCPRHLWRPFSSHSNRAWHFLGEAGVAFLGEIDGAEDWVWFAMNVFFNVYPVWSDDDGGWHEGVSYWSSYIGRFTWWADIMREGVGIDAYRKPYFSKAGYYAMYLMPPGKVGGSFGDGANRRRSRDLSQLMSQLAAQAGNSHWQWWVEAHGGPVDAGGYIGFIRGTLPEVEAEPPADLPSSRLFRGIGQAFLNTTLRNAGDDVQVVFKSSPRGTWSHGSDANNSITLWAYGERLLVRSGHYYNYGGPHHEGWVWSTRSVNNITVNGEGQIKRSAAARGEILDFHTSASVDAVVGEAGGAYRVADAGGGERSPLERYTRTVLFVKPDLVIVHDRLVAGEPSSFEYWLHAVNRFEIESDRRVQVRAGDVTCAIAFLAPDGLVFDQTDQYDPNPWPRIKTREWHLSGRTSQKRTACEFVVVYQPRREEGRERVAARLETAEGGRVLKGDLHDGRVVILFPREADSEMSLGDFATTGRVALRRYDEAGNIVEEVRLGAKP